MSKFKKSLGKILGAAAGVLLAPVTGGASLALAAGLGAGAGHVLVDAPKAAAKKQAAAFAASIPEPAIPAPPASPRRLDTGASVAIGTSADIKNQRVSGRSAGGRSGRIGDILGGLGRGGLNI